MYLGVAAWVGSQFQDHARVSFAVKIGKPKPKVRSIDKRAWHQKMTLKQWQGISHQIDDSLRTLAMQSLERLKDGGGDADLEKRKMIETRLAAAKMVMPGTSKEHQGRMPFRSKQQQVILRTRVSGKLSL